MTTAVDAERPILRSHAERGNENNVPWRMRPELTACRQRYQGRACWVVKDPLALTYHRFADEEYALLRWLDGRRSLDEIQDEFQRQFVPQKVTREELQGLLARLEQSGLIVCDLPGQSRRLLQKREERRRAARWATATQWLAVKFRGIDPERFLGWLYPQVRFLFAPWCVALCLALILAAGLLVLVEFHVFRARLPGFYGFFTPENAVWLAVVLALTKILHEFGHALTARHWGGECHEMGVMLLVFTPCLYCNVSDSWMEASKWRRAAVAAAGMYVELVLAAAATFLWWFSQPGLFNHLCLNTMFVCGANTLVFNGNPLLRYDGYYILSDLAEIPNLRQKAAESLHRTLAAWCLGLTDPADPFSPRGFRPFFAAFAVASGMYRWIVTFSILWFLNQVFAPYRLEILGRMIAAVALCGLVGIPLCTLARFFWTPGRARAVNRIRTAATLSALLGLIALFVLVPFPHRIHTSLVLEPHAAQRVYVEVPGTLGEVLVQPGMRVEPGMPLARLVNLDIDLGLAELSAERAQRQAEVEDLQRQRFADAAAAAQIPAVAAAVAVLEERLRNRQADADRLTLSAPCAGQVLSPPEIKPHPSPSGPLPRWSGTPLLPRNTAGYLEAGTLFCLVGDPQRLDALLVIDQSDVEFVRAGQQVEIQLEQQPGKIFHGTIAELARLDLSVAPRQLSPHAGGELATTRDRAGQERPLSTSYQARVELADPDRLLLPGLRGRAKIHSGRQTWYQWSGRTLSQTFHFRL